MHIRILIALLALPLTGCYAIGSSQTERLVPARPVSNIVSDTLAGSFEGAWAAVQMPLEDIGLKKQRIPEPLEQISDNPYAASSPIPCEDIRKEIAELDNLLGPDICTTDNPTGAPVSRKGEYVEQGAKAAREQAVNMVKSKINIIPFRGVVRRITGAEKNSKAYAHAVEAGKLRRAFLKGLASSMGPQCLNPLPLPPSPATQPNPPAPSKAAPIEINLDTLTTTLQTPE